MDDTFAKPIVALADEVVLVDELEVSVVDVPVLVPVVVLVSVVVVEVLVPVVVPVEVDVSVELDDDELVVFASLLAAMACPFIFLAILIL